MTMLSRGVAAVAVAAALFAAGAGSAFWWVNHQAEGDLREADRQLEAAVERSSHLEEAYEGVRHAADSLEHLVANQLVVNDSLSRQLDEQDRALEERLVVVPPDVDVPSYPKPLVDSLLAVRERRVVAAERRARLWEDRYLLLQATHGQLALAYAQRGRLIERQEAAVAARDQLVATMRARSKWQVTARWVERGLLLVLAVDELGDQLGGG